MNQIRPIQTRYKGYHFRSRLEARWAVFFDAMGFKWQYEPEGYVLPDGTHYLPDFRIEFPIICGEVATLWVEIKPSLFSEKFMKFMAALPDDWRVKGTILKDIPEPDEKFDADCIFTGKDGGADHGWEFSACDRCGRTGFSFSGYVERYCEHGEKACQGWENDKKVNDALVAARSARFEHGETPGGR